MVAARTVHTTPVGQVTGTLTGLQRQLDELARRSATGFTAPICRVKLNADLPLAAGVEYFAQDSWIVGEDPDGDSALSSTTGTYSYLQIPLTGRYLVRTRAVFTSPAAASTMTAFVTQNSMDSSASIVRENKNSTNYGSDGTIIASARDVLLNQTDVLFWGYWSYSACTLSSLSINVPTEVSIVYLGPR